MVKSTGCQSRTELGASEIISRSYFNLHDLFGYDMDNTQW